MAATEARTAAKPGKDSWQQWPGHLTVEYGPAEAGTITDGVIAKTTPVYLDGERIGTIKVARERTYRKANRLGLGNIRQPSGYATRWQIRSIRGPVSRPGIDLRYTSRAEATARLIAFHLTGDTTGKIE